MMRHDTIILGDSRERRRVAGAASRRILRLLILVSAVGYAVWAAASMRERTFERQALIDISRIEQAARFFRADLGRCPDNMGELLRPPERLPYLQRIEDPWGRAYELTCPARFDPGAVEVISGGPDRSLAGSDNISSL